MAENLDLLESFDNFAGLRNALRTISRDKEEWAGIPMPIEGEHMVIEPTYPLADLFNSDDDDKDDDGSLKFRNTFWSHRYRRDVLVYEKDGRVRHTWAPGVGHLDHQLRTLGCSFAWGIEQEGNALHTLATLIRHHSFKCYVLTGMFLESSPRSGITYLFRKLRPTVALKARDGDMHVLCAMCMHPIGYYYDSWAGAMCPTDDVIAHLMLMRGDEKMFWKRCNQHEPHRPEAGL